MVHGATLSMPCHTILDSLLQPDPLQRLSVHALGPSSLFLSNWAAALPSSSSSSSSSGEGEGDGVAAEVDGDGDGDGDGAGDGGGDGDGDGGGGGGDGGDGDGDGEGSGEDDSRSSVDDESDIAEDAEVPSTDNLARDPPLPAPFESLIRHRPFKRLIDEVLADFDPTLSFELGAALELRLNAEGYLIDLLRDATGQIQPDEGSTLQPKHIQRARRARGERS